jgi:hypothetical protein
MRSEPKEKTDTFSVEAAAHERQSLEGFPVNPLRIIDDAQDPRCAALNGQDAESG